MSSKFDVDDVILNYDPAAPASPLPRRRAGSCLPAGWRGPAAAHPLARRQRPQGRAARHPAGRNRRSLAFLRLRRGGRHLDRGRGFGTGRPVYLGSFHFGWYEYRHDIATYIQLVTGAQAPFNSRQADMDRSYQSLGLYFPCTIGSARVLLFKSGLHLAYDGPAIPVRRLMAEIAEAVAPKLFITTGTAGGIGADVLLGDVVIAGTVRFDCKTQFATQPWAAATYQAPPLPPGALAAITPSLTSINAARLPGARPAPQTFSATTDANVTTDFFAFDDSTDHYGLEGLGRTCDMGDAMVANALQSLPNIAWYSIRNASDPQIANPSGNMEQASRQAAEIYAKYGGLTTAASVIATWAVIQAAITANP